jgi:hypothetical protein
MTATNAQTAAAGAAYIPHYDVKRITLRGWREINAPIGDEFNRSEWQYLVGRLDPNADAFVTIRTWSVEANEWALAPEWLAEYRARTTSGGPQRNLLAVEYTYDPEGDHRIEDAVTVEEFDEALSDSSERSEIDFAWRLERHWHVEWLDLPRGERRPPVVFLGSGFTTVLLGLDLPTRLTSAAAALVAFQLLTADELRAAFRFLGEPEPTAADLSRALSYFEEVGLIVSAAGPAVNQYWQTRSVGRRPLRLFASVLSDARDWRAWTWSTQRDSPTALSCGYDPRHGLNPEGTPGATARIELEKWQSYVLKLRARGLRST